MPDGNQEPPMTELNETEQLIAKTRSINLAVTRWRLIREKGHVHELDRSALQDVRRYTNRWIGRYAATLALVILPSLGASGFSYFAAAFLSNAVWMVGSASIALRFANLALDASLEGHKARIKQRRLERVENTREARRAKQAFMTEVREASELNGVSPPTAIEEDGTPTYQQANEFAQRLTEIAVKGRPWVIQASRKGGTVQRPIGDWRRRRTHRTEGT